MRRKDREITSREELVDVIKQCDVCRLVLNDETYPYIVPLNYGMREENGKVVLYFHSALEGEKLNLIRKNPHATFEMDCEHKLVLDDETMSCTMEYRSVIGHGVIEFVPEEDKYDALCVLMAHYHVEEFPFNQAVMPRTAVFKLTVADMTGKRRKKK